MSYGTTAYGAAAYGGIANSANEQIFFPLALYSPDVLREAEAIFTGSEEFYSIFTVQNGEPISGPIGTEYKIYKSNGEGETPQLQATIQGNTHVVIGAAARIVVTMIVDGSQFGSGIFLSVTGRPGS
jgi:hypothetical protein